MYTDERAHAGEPTQAGERSGTGSVLRRPLGHFAERSLAGLALVVGTGVGFAVLLMLVRAQWRPLYAVDRGVAARLNELIAPHGPLVTLLNAVTNLGGRAIIIWLVTVAVVGLLIRRQGRLAVYLIVTGLGALLLDPATKSLVARLRPAVDVPIGTYAGTSFPSGHALGSIVAYGALLLVFLPAIPRRWRRLAIVLVATVVVAVGLTRIALGVHFVSDVLGAWLLGLAWLGVTGYAFRLWRLERGRPIPSLAEGLEPEAAPEVAPAPDEDQVVPHPRAVVAEVLTGWVLVFGLLYGFGMWVSHYAAGSFVERLDTAVPEWFAAQRSSDLNDVSYWASRAGDTHAILLVSLIFCPLILAVWRRWRPVLFIALAMFGELTLFLALSAAVDRPRPEVQQLDGHLPTSSYPSGHIAATLCLYTGIALLVMPRTDRWWRWLTVALAVVMPFIVATSRMYRGMHNPTDIAGAVLLMTLWIGVLYWVIRPNADLRADNRPTIAADEAHRLDDELAKADRPG